jgi:VCBS repeat-containing protein
MKTKPIRSRVINWSVGLLGVLCALAWPTNHLEAANTPPTVSVNTGLTLNEGTLGSITSAQLTFVDAQQGAAAITYTITTLPTKGQLLFNGSALALNGTFTQANINSGALKYSHDGTDTTSDSFAFTVSDGAGGSVPGQTFNLTITPVNDATALATPVTLTFTSAPGGSFALDGMGGSTDINGLALEVYFGDASRNQINSAITYETPYPPTSGLVVNYTNAATQDGYYYLIIKSRNSGDNFWLQSLQLSDYGGNNPKIEAFDNGVSRGSVNVTTATDPWVFTFDQTGALTPSIFNNVDEVRISGQDSGIIWLAINNLRIAAPVLPNTSPTFVGTTTTLTVGENSSANDLKSLLHVSDPDASQTETWSQSSAPSHGTLTFTSATAVSGSADITPGGIIAYTPTAGYTGSDSFTVQVSDGNGGTATRSITVTINPPTGITSASTASGTYGSAFTYTITASNSPTAFGASGLPTGLTLNGSSGLISGTPHQSGSFPIALSATNATSYATASLTLTLTQVNLTVSGIIASNKVYDGTAVAKLGFSGATLNGVISGDAITLNPAGASATFADANVGTGKAVTITGLTLLGTMATNYTLTQPTATANITAAPATVVINRSVQLYNGSPKSVTNATVPGGLSVAMTYNGSSTAPSSVGAYTVVGTVTSANYSGGATNYLYIAVAPQYVKVHTNGAGSILMTWSSMPSVNYQVQSTPSLQPVAWSNFNSPVSATDTNTTTQDVIDRNLVMRLYRVGLILE